MEPCKAALDSSSRRIFTYIMDGSCERSSDEGSCAAVGRPSSAVVERTGQQANGLNWNLDCASDGCVTLGMLCKLSVVSLYTSVSGDGSNIYTVELL